MTTGNGKPHEPASEDADEHFHRWKEFVENNGFKPVTKYINEKRPYVKKAQTKQERRRSKIK